MKTKAHLFTAILTVAMLIAGAHGIDAQSKMAKMQDKPMDMSQMMKAPHHMLIMAHMKSMSEFTRTLHHQAMMPMALDAEFARAAVAELRHDFDAIAAIHQKHMGSMSPEMKSKMDGMSPEMKAKMQVMMEKMDKERSLINDQVSALETDVKAKTPDSKQVAMHATALLKHLDMMSKMHGGTKAGMKMAMK
ncbi:MAG: hypothetical protein ABI539_02290 [Acidobacteriota bacterium]